MAAGALSLLLSLAAGALVFFGGVVAVVALINAGQAETSWSTGVLTALLGIAALVAGIALVGRARPWLVRRLVGVEVHRLPWLLSVMWNAPQGSSSPTSGGDGGSAGGTG